MAGAAAIQVGTAIFYDPALPERIVDALEENGIPEALGD
jgi:dihydroorotate dehydrogenase